MIQSRVRVFPPDSRTGNCESLYFEDTAWGTGTVLFEAVIPTEKFERGWDVEGEDED